MKGDNKKYVICPVGVSVTVMVTYLLSDSKMVLDRETNRMCGFLNLNSLGSVSDIQIKESTLSHRFSITKLKRFRYYRYEEIQSEELIMTRQRANVCTNDGFGLAVCNGRLFVRYIIG